MSNTKLIISIFIMFIIFIIIFYLYKFKTENFEIYETSLGNEVDYPYSIKNVDGIYYKYLG